MFSYCCGDQATEKVVALFSFESMLQGLQNLFNTPRRPVPHQLLQPRQQGRTPFPLPAPQQPTQATGRFQVAPLPELQLAIRVRQQAPRLASWAARLLQHHLPSPAASTAHCGR